MRNGTFEGVGCAAQCQRIPLSDRLADRSKPLRQIFEEQVHEFAQQLLITAHMGHQRSLVEAPARIYAAPRARHRVCGGPAE
jgi:hypothetical protein